MQEEVADFFSASPALRLGGEWLLVDATVGFGGHTNRLLGLGSSMRGGLSLSESTIFTSKICAHAIDADSHMLAVAKERLLSYGNAVVYYHDFFDNYFVKAPNESIDFILLDLGVSLYHFRESGRGFSHSVDAPLDMRLSPSASLQATDIINRYSLEALTNIFYNYGEERQAVKWAKRILTARANAPITTTVQLCETLQLGKKAQDRTTLARIFQSLRIEVNEELARIQRSLPEAWRALKLGGRIAIISFHSLEDRIVKHFFKFIGGKLKIDEKNPIYNDKYYDAQLNTGTILTKKPVVASEKELRQNIASRSAKLRVAEKKV